MKLGFIFRPLLYQEINLFLIEESFSKSSEFTLREKEEDYYVTFVSRKEKSELTLYFDGSLYYRVDFSHESTRINRILSIYGRAAELAAEVTEIYQSFCYYGIELVLWGKGAMKQYKEELTTLSKEGMILDHCVKIPFFDSMLLDIQFDNSDNG